MIELSERIYTADEYVELAQSDAFEGRLVELVEGRLIEMAGGGSGKHGETIVRFTVRVGNFVEANNLGRLTGAETGFLLNQTADGRQTIRCPDLAFIAIDRAREPLGDGYVPFAPDLALEVVSPGNDAQGIQEKVEQFLAAGTRLVWVVYPKTRNVLAYSPDGVVAYRESDTLDGSDVLPGFSVRVADLFPK